ncbi:MAG: DNA-binding protein [Bacteroidales bacterium]|nr:DNA-binding protein [Bacteroidales bacterium]
MKKEKVIVEVSNDGLFSAYMSSDAHDFGIAGFGDNEDEAIEDFYEAYANIKEVRAEKGKATPEFEFEILYDKESLLKYYSNLIGISTMHKLTGLPQKRLAQYIQNETRPTENSMKKIQKGLRQFSESLQRIALL